MTVNVSIIYYSSTGTTYDLACAMQTAAQAMDGVNVRFRKARETAPQEAIEQNEAWKNHLEATEYVEEATIDDLEWADVILLGTPTRFGLPAAQLKSLIDMAGPLWQEGKLVGKVGSTFMSAATAHGGHETTLVALNNTFYHWGCIIVPPAYADPIQFQSGTPYGTSFVSNNGELDPDETALNAAKFQAEHAIKIARKLAD